MIATTDLTSDELQDLQDSTGEADVGTALRLAVREYVRYVKRMRLLDMAGKVEMDDNWHLLEQAELDEQASNAATSAD